MRTYLSVQATTRTPDRLHFAAPRASIADQASAAQQRTEVRAGDRRRQRRARPIAVLRPPDDRHRDQDPPVGRLHLLLPREPPPGQPEVRDRLRLLEVLHERKVLLV